MFSDASKAFSQMFQRPFRAILWKSLGFTIALLIVLWIVLEGVVVHYVDLPYAWLDTVLSILTGIGAFVGLGFLIAPISALFVAFFQDDIAEIVEKTDYPADPPGKPLPLVRSLILSLRFTGVVILGNLIALILLLVPGVNLVAFFLVNGYLLGREFFEFAAMRFLPPEEARALRGRNGAWVFLAGLGIAVVLAIPILNLLTPIFATIFMVHLCKRLQRRAARL